MACGFGARLGYLPDGATAHNDSAWAAVLTLLSVPVLGALHISAVHDAAGVPVGPAPLGQLTRAFGWAYLRLAALAVLLCGLPALALGVLGQAAFGTADLALLAMPLVGGLLTYAPSLLVVDVSRSAADAIVRSAAWVLRGEALRLVGASVAVTLGEVVVVRAGVYLGWMELPLRVLLAGAAVVLTGATAAYVVAQHSPERLLQSLVVPPVPARRSGVRAMACAVGVAGLAAYVVVAVQPLSLARTAGSGGEEQQQMAWASVRNIDGVPVTLTAAADSTPRARLTDVGISMSPLPEGWPDDWARTLHRSVTLAPGQSAIVYARWAITPCAGSDSSSDAPLRTWVISHVGPLTQRHLMPTTSALSQNCS